MEHLAKFGFSIFLMSESFNCNIWKKCKNCLEIYWNIKGLKQAEHVWSIRERFCPYLAHTNNTQQKLLVFHVISLEDQMVLFLRYCDECSSIKIIEHWILSVRIGWTKTTSIEFIGKLCKRRYACVCKQQKECWRKNHSCRKVMNTDEWKTTPMRIFAFTSQVYQA